MKMDLSRRSSKVSGVFRIALEFHVDVGFRRSIKAFPNRE
jgi:hypothetical protein